jgi:hypothetical protein
MVDNPGRIDSEFDVDIAWPRHSDQPELLKAHRRLMRQFERSSLPSADIAINEINAPSITNAA